MKVTIKIGPRTGVTYFPREIRREGFIGTVEGLPDARTFTLIKPGTRLADVKHSPETIIRDIELRMQYEEEL